MKKRSEKNSIKVEKGTICRLTSSADDNAPSDVLFSSFNEGCEAERINGSYKSWIPVSVAVKYLEGIVTDQPEKTTIVWISK